MLILLTSFKPHGTIWILVDKAFSFASDKTNLIRKSKKSSVGDECCNITIATNQAGVAEGDKVHDIVQVAYNLIVPLGKAESHQCPCFSTPHIHKINLMWPFLICIPRIRNLGKYHKNTYH